MVSNQLFVIKNIWKGIERSIDMEFVSTLIYNEIPWSLKGQLMYFAIWNEMNDMLFKFL